MVFPFSYIKVAVRSYCVQLLFSPVAVSLDALNSVAMGAFSLERLCAYKNVKAALDYAYKNLECLGIGSAREVYKFDGKALKVAVGKNGIAQNMVEGNASYNDYDCFAKVYARDKDYKWILMELCEPFEEEPDLESVYGMKHANDFFRLDCDDLCCFLYVVAGHENIEDLDNPLVEYYLKKYNKSAAFRRTGLGKLFASLEEWVLNEMPSREEIEDLHEGNWGLVERNGKR